MSLKPAEATLWNAAPKTKQNKKPKNPKNKTKQKKNKNKKTKNKKKTQKPTKKKKPHPKTGIAAQASISVGSQTPHLGHGDRKMKAEGTRAYIESPCLK